MKITQKSGSWYVKSICLFFSLCLLGASIFAAFYLEVWDVFLIDWLRILTSPSPLVTDYFQLGNLASAFFNAAVCGLACNALMLMFDNKYHTNTIAGYFLVVAHCFYGLNFVNMWPPIFGILLYCRIRQIKFRKNLDMAMFSTAFGPFVSELLFRYPFGENFVASIPQVSIVSFFYVLLFTLFLTMTIPAMLPGANKMHKGYDLYNAGLAFGLLGFLIYAFMYKTLGISAPVKYTITNELYDSHNNSYMTFCVIFFAIVFTLYTIWGYYANGKSFNGYHKLMDDSGHRADFIDDYGSQMVVMNIGLYGFMILAYFVAVILFTDGAGFTGPTVGVIIAALSFTARGQHPKNVWPILAGFVALYLLVLGISTFTGSEMTWTLSTQGYINAAAFATGLCPIVGVFGRRYGILAGIVCAIICTSTSAIHGGFVLYNGGFSAGLTALLVQPVLEFYLIRHKRKPREE